MLGDHPFRRDRGLGHSCFERSGKQPGRRDHAEWHPEICRPMAVPLMAARDIPEAMADRLIVALDVPTIERAAQLAGQLHGIVSFFKVGLWLLFAPGAERFVDGLIADGKRIFLDAKMYDIGETVRQGVARAVERGVSFVTVHGDPDIMRAAAAGKAGSARTKVFAVSVLTSQNDA